MMQKYGNNTEIGMLIRFFQFNILFVWTLHATIIQTKQN